MLAEFCWTLARDVPTVEYKRQAKRKKKKKKEKNMILCVLNNELASKILCRCSIYVVNIIPKQNKSTKHILFYGIVFSFFIQSTVPYTISTYFIIHHGGSIILKLEPSNFYVLFLTS